MPEVTSLERCMTVLESRVPDRVPVCLENFQHAAAVAGYTLREYCLDGEKMAAAQIAAWEKFGHDMIDMENGVATLAGAVGCEVRYKTSPRPHATTLRICRTGAGSSSARAANCLTRRQTRMSLRWLRRRGNMANIIRVSPYRGAK